VADHFDKRRLLKAIRRRKRRNDIRGRSYPHPGRKRDHPRNAVSTRRNAAKLTSLPARTYRPWPSSISIKPDDGPSRRGDELDRAGTVGCGASNICTEMKTGTRVRPEHPLEPDGANYNIRLSQMPWRVETPLIRAPGSCVSATMSRLSATLRHRRRSRPCDQLHHAFHRHSSNHPLSTYLRWRAGYPRRSSAEGYGNGGSSHTISFSGRHHPTHRPDTWTARSPPGQQRGLDTAWVRLATQHEIISRT
jgi:hypothetical protein